VIVARLQAHKCEEALEIPALFTLREDRGGDLQGEVGLQPSAETVGFLLGNCRQACYLSDTDQVGPILLGVHQNASYTAAYRT
jgi:hypothetical protein